MEIFQNPWVIGILTGILSGVIVFFLTKWIMDKRGRTEYFKQVSRANQSIINTLKPYIADRGLPKSQVFECLIASTSRDFDVAQKDMLSIEEYCEELIREVMSDVYVSGTKKEEYITDLAEYISSRTKSSIEQMTIEAHLQSGKYAKKTATQVSLYIALLVATMTMILSLTITFSAISGSSLFASLKNSSFWIPVTVSIVSILVSSLIFLSEASLRRLRKRRSNITTASTSDNKDSFR